MSKPHRLLSRNVPSARRIPLHLYSIGRTTKYALALLSMCILAPLAGGAGRVLAQSVDTTRSMAPDSVLMPSADIPSAPPGNSRLKDPVEFSATDSLVIDLRSKGAEQATLYREGKVTYGDATLSAHSVQILFDINELRAAGLPVDTGMVGRPQFEQGSTSFSGVRLAYNMQTERGRVVEASTSIEDGFIRGGVVKVDEDSTLYILNGAYSTCGCDEAPSYSLRANRMKIVDKEWIYTGPIQLFLFNIPTPLWLPFGFLPAKEGRRTGPLPPNYGEDERGFYLRDFGWYFAISDYMDFQIQGGLWTKGSWQLSPRFRYNKRYAYSGALSLDYGRNRRGEKGDRDLSIVSTAALRWNHSQPLSPTANFSSNVNLSTSSYLRTVSQQYNDRVRQTIESSIRYSNRWANAGRSFTMDMNQRQVLATGQASLTLPSVSFVQNSRKPFSRSTRAAGRDERWYELITYSYSSRLNNQFNFNPLNADTLINRGDPEAADISWYEALVSPAKYRRATGLATPFDIRASHNIPVSASFTVNRLPVINKTFRMNISTGISYTEDWYTRTQRRDLDTTLNRVTTSDIPGFFAFRQVSSSLSANTTFYGLFPVRVGAFQGLRHTVRPNLSFSYSPDYTTDFWGYTRTYLNAQGQPERYAITPSGAGTRQQTASFRIDNVFETKHVRTDSTGEDQSETIQLLNVDLSAGYNFAADSLRLSDINLNARTSIAGKFDLTFNTSFSPYVFDPARNQIYDDFVLDLRRFKVLRMTRLDFAARTSFRSGETGLTRPASSLRMDQNPSMVGLNDGRFTDDPFSAPFTNSNVGGYADFAIPWSLNLDFTFGISRPYAILTRSAILNSSFDFNLTPKWKVQGRSGYDFGAMEVVTTSLSIFRDLGCWEMSFNWIPFGRYQSYGFDLHVKSGKLADILRLRQPKSDIRGRFDGVFQ